MTSLHFGFTKPSPVRSERIAEDEPFRILVLADLAGHGTRPPLAERRPIRVTSETLESVIHGLAPQVRLPVGDAGGHHMVVGIGGMDDFHPDRLAASLPVFQLLARMKKLLADPGMYEGAAAQIRAWLGASAPPAQHPTSPPAEAEPEADAVQRLLGMSPAQGGQAAQTAHSAVDELVRQIVAPHVVPDAPADRPHLERLLDDAMAMQMRAILHQPAFQALESAWRGVEMLVSRLDEDRVQVHVLDVSARELATNLEGELRQSRLWKLAARSEQPQGQAGWALLVADRLFGPDPTDMTLLARLGRVAREAQAPMLAGASPRVLGCQSLERDADVDRWTQPVDLEEWEGLRQLPEAGWVALAFPRVVMRLPYGSQTDPIEAFTFEESEPKLSHEQYLWGNGAFVCALVLGEAFMEQGWDLLPSGFAEVQDVPLHTWREAGEVHVKPPAEAFLTDRAAGLIQQRGIIPLLSLKGRDAVRLAGFQSLALPPQPLMGRWG